MWKSILDTWLDRDGSGQGAVFAQHRRKDLTQSTHDSAAGESKLPTFWKQSIRALRKLPLVPTDPAHFSLEGARVIPYWFNALFQAPKLKREEFWRSTLRLNSLKDLFKDDCSDFSAGEVLDEIERLVRVEGDRGLGKSQERTTALLRDWDSAQGTVLTVNVPSIWPRPFGGRYICKGIVTYHRN